MLLNITPQFKKEALAAFAACLLIFHNGTTIGWTSPAIPSLQKDPAFKDLITDDITSWIGALLCLGSLIGSAVSPLLLPLIGPKWTMMLFGLPGFAASYILILAAPLYPNIWWFYSSRILMGVSVSLAVCSVPPYIIDIASPEHQGILGLFVNLFFCSGILVAFLTGAVTNWYYLTLACLCYLIPFAVIFPFMPDSPSSLTSRGKHKQAQRALKWLNHPQALPKYQELNQPQSLPKSQELNYPQSLPQSQELNHPQSLPKSQELNHIPHLKTQRESPPSFHPRQLLKAENLRPFLVSLSMQYAMQFSGISPLQFFIQSFFEDAKTSIDASLSSIIVASIQLGTILVVGLSASSAPRRTLMLVSQGGITVCHFLMALYFLLTKFGLTQGYQWLPLAILVIFFVFFNIGIASFVWVVTAEVLPPSIRSVANSIAILCGGVFFFLTSFLFNIMFETLGGSGLFLFYGCASLLLFVSSLFFLPETKEKTAEELNDFFTNYRLPWRRR